MPARKILLLVVALMIAGLTVILTRSNGSAPGTKTPGPDVVQNEILVATRDMPSGTLIKETDLKWEKWSAEKVPEGYITRGKPEKAEEKTGDKAEYEGAVVRYGIKAGEPIMEGRIVKAHEQGFMAAVLEPGMRAVSVFITPAGGVAGFVFPGDHVDVILSHEVKVMTNREGSSRRETAEQHKVSETILEDVKVLALDQRTDDQAKKPEVARTATLQVTPKQAERLALVPEMGVLSLALRSLAHPAPEADGTAKISEDGPKMARKTTTWDSDVSGAITSPDNRLGNQQHVQIMRGGNTSEAVFDLHK